MSLNEQLETLSADMARKLPEGVGELMRKKARELADSDILPRSHKAGEAAPDFILPNVRGTETGLTTQLARGPVVLSFYRGGWCPYCNLELRALQASLPEFRARGASLLAVSPQTPDNSLSTAQKNELAFEVLSDRGNLVARRYGLVFQVPEELRPIYAQFGIDLPASNGEASFELPVPATFVIDRKGIIQFAFVDTDYRRRAEPASLLAALDRLG